MHGKVEKESRGIGKHDVEKKVLLVVLQFGPLLCCVFLGFILKSLFCLNIGLVVRLVTLPLNAILGACNFLGRNPLIHW